ncbi:MAG: GNAT family N-acetyltransferase [Bacillota bacterium]
MQFGGPGPQFLVAQLGGKVVGYNYNTIVRGLGHLARVGVHREYAGRGIGRQLCRRAIDWFNFHGVASELNTQASNPATHRLYPSLGYRRSGQFELMDRQIR